MSYFYTCERNKMVQIAELKFDLLYFQTFFNVDIRVTIFFLTFATAYIHLVFE